MGDFLIRRLGPLHITLLRAVLGAAGRQVEPVLVGGAVRDGCLGRPGPIDLDVAVPARGPAIARRVADRLGGAFVLLDAERGAAGSSSMASGSTWPTIGRRRWNRT
jgi:hypothetical protein